MEAREQELLKREREIARREMRMNARSLLRERELPEALLEALNYEDEERLQQSLDSTERAFRAAVERGVMDRMRGEAPKRDAPHKEKEELSDEEYYRRRQASGGK